MPVGRAAPRTLSVGHISPWTYPPDRCFGTGGRSSRGRRRAPESAADGINQLTERGGNVLHSVFRGGKTSGGICPGEKCPVPSPRAAKKPSHSHICIFPVPDCMSNMDGHRKLKIGKKSDHEVGAKLQMLLEAWIVRILCAKSSNYRFWFLQVIEG